LIVNDISQKPVANGGHVGTSGSRVIPNPILITDFLAVFGGVFFGPTRTAISGGPMHFGH
jgi:hypothetical protein